MQPIHLNSGGDPVISGKKSPRQQNDPIQQTQPIHINGGRDPVISAKRSPTQQTDPMQQMQPIYINGGGDLVISAELTFKLFSEGHCGQYFHLNDTHASWLLHCQFFWMDGHTFGFLDL